MTTITELKQRNEKAGKYFFSKGAMRFFHSRILSRVIDAKNGTGFYFVTSEQFDNNSRRLFTVRFMRLSGEVDDIGEFQAHETSAQAYSAINAHNGSK